MHLLQPLLCALAALPAFQATAQAGQEPAPAAEGPAPAAEDPAPAAEDPAPATQPWGQLVYVARERVADPELAARLDAYGGADARRFVLVLTDEAQVPGADRCLAPESLAGADDPELARAMLAADVLVLRGGTFMQWYDTVYPPSTRTRLARALQDFVQTRRPILAYGGACAFLSGGVSVPLEELRKPERNPRRTEPYRPRVALGVGPRAMFEADGWRGATPLRLMQALRSTYLDHGFYFVDDVALELTRDPARLRVLGPGEVLLFDLSRARRGRDRVQEARLSRLLEGDVWDIGSERVVVGDGRARRERVEPRPANDAGGPLGPGGAGLSAFLEQQAAPRPARSLTRPTFSSAQEFEASWTLRWDAGAEVHAPPEGAGRATLLGLPCDCRWGPLAQGR